MRDLFKHTDSIGRGSYVAPRQEAPSPTTETRKQRLAIEKIIHTDGALTEYDLLLISSSALDRERELSRARKSQSDPDHDWNSHGSYSNPYGL